MLQAQYAFYKSDKTWERGILEMIKGNEEDAYKILGYILHLIEDSSVPEHTRNDTHAHVLEGVTEDYGSAYEEYLKKYTRQNLDIASDFYQQGLRPATRATIDEYLIFLAQYSNKYFFSKDTINDSKYQNPKIIKNDGNFGYGLDENGKEFPLVKIIDAKNKKYTIDIIDTYILDAYFSRLSRQAVLNGAGVINLFFEEAESKKEYPSRLVIYDFSIFNYFIIPKVSIAGESIRIGNAIQSLTGQISSAINGAVSSDSNFFSRSSDNNEISQQSIQNNSQNIQTSKQDSQNNNSELIELTAINTKLPQNNEQDSFTSVSQISENQLISQQKLLLELQSQLNEINNKANNLNNQIKLLALQSSANNYYSTHFGGGGGGGGGGAPVILSTSENNTSAENQQSDNQQQITQDYQQNSTSISQSASSTEIALTSTSTIAILSLNHLVISEIQIEGVNADDEFIELYNPTNQIISLADYSIQYISGKATSTEKIGNTKKNFKNDAQIIPYGFYLLAQKDGVFAQRADMTYSFSLSGNSTGATIFLNSSSLPISSLVDQSIIDYVSYGEASLAGVSTTTFPLSGQGLERKAWQNSDCVFPQGIGEFLGNSCDNDNGTDFEIRLTPNPQNYSNLPEPRNTPTTPQNFNIQYSSSTDELIFNWLESQDYSGSTSTLTYKIQEINNSSSSLPLIETISTSVAVTISELGRNYEFDILASDKDGLESATSSANIYVDAPQIPSVQILLSQLDESSSSDWNAWIYQEFGNGISGKLQSLEFKMSSSGVCQYFSFQEFNDAGYNQLSRSFSDGTDFIVRRADTSIWGKGSCPDNFGEIITIEFNNIEADPSKYYRLYLITGDASRQASFIGSDFDAGFGNFKVCSLKSDVGNGIVYRWQECFTPNFDIYFILKGTAINANLPIQQ